MSYKFLRLSTLYGEALELHYKNVNLKKNPSYDELFQLLHKKDFFLPYMFESYLQSMYGIATEILVINDFYLQSAWAREHNLALTGNELVLEQVKKINPDVVMVEDLSRVSTSLLQGIKARGVRVLLGHHCAPHTEQIVQNMKILDVLMTCSPKLADDYRKLGVRKVEVIYHAFDKSILNRITNHGVKKSGAVFTGSFLVGEGLHAERRELVEHIVKSGIELEVYSHEVRHGRSRRRALLKHNVFKKMGLHEKANKIDEAVNLKDQLFWYTIRNRVHKPLYGTKMFDLINASLVCLNNHGEVAGSYAANMRLFEVTGIGTCLLTDSKLNMNDLFTPDVECITYESKEEAAEKLKWLLSNPAKAMEIAMAGHERCLRDHSYEVRTRQLHQLVRDNLK